MYIHLRPIDSSFCDLITFLMEREVHRPVYSLFSEEHSNYLALWITVPNSIRCPQKYRYVEIPSQLLPTPCADTIPHYLRQERRQYPEK